MTQIEVTPLYPWMGDDLKVANAARVSFRKESGLDWVCKTCGHVLDQSGYRTDCMQRCMFKQTLKQSDERLIKFLAKNKHISPFGHCFMSFHVKAPIFVARQLVKHKFLRWNEVSRRYVTDDPEFYVATYRMKAENVKQGSAGQAEESQQQLTKHEFERVEKAALSAYMNALDDGIAPEQARAILPASLMTEWYWSGSLDAFADMARLRIASDTQAESSEVAKQVDEYAKEYFPVSWRALLGEV